MPRRRYSRYSRDRLGRFTTTGSSSRRRISKRRAAATGATFALGALYALDGKGPYRVAGATLAGAAGLYGAVQTRRR